MHHIQKNILDRLSTAIHHRYSDVKPTHLDGNVFAYHLKQLIADKLVAKSLTGDYTLTSAGKEYIVRRYENPLLQAHSIFLIVLRRGDTWLMRERLVQPLLGMSGFIHGEPVANEDLLATAKHRLFDKTGLSLPLTIFSSGLIKITQGDTIESFSHAIILTGETNDDFTISQDMTGRQFWQPADALSDPSILPSCVDLIQRINTNDRSMFVLNYNVATK